MGCGVTDTVCVLTTVLFTRTFAVNNSDPELCVHQHPDPGQCTVTRPPTAYAAWSILLMTSVLRSAACSLLQIIERDLSPTRHAPFASSCLGTTQCRAVEPSESSAARAAAACSHSSSDLQRRVGLGQTSGSRPLAVGAPRCLFLPRSICCVPHQTFLTLSSQ